MSTKKSTKKKKTKKKKTKKPAAAPTKVKALVGKPDKFWKLPEKIAGKVFPDDSGSLVVVRFNDKCGLNHPKASYRNADSYTDQVWFCNGGKKKRNLDLVNWVFLEPEATIVVPPHCAIGPFHLDTGKPFVGTVVINTTPPSEGPPGDPGFDTDG